MWLFLPFGYYSIAEKKPNSKEMEIMGKLPSEDCLVIRTRTKGDLERFLEYVDEDEQSAICHDTGTDYQYRAWVTRSAVAKMMTQFIGTINYSKFKPQVSKALPNEPHHSVFMNIWSVLWGLSPNDRYRGYSYYDDVHNHPESFFYSNKS